MSSLVYRWLWLLGAWLPVSDGAEIITAPAPTQLSVTVYRASQSASGSLNLDALRGFALVTEHRTLSIPAGESVIRFPGVADGIRSSTVILAGLPVRLLETDDDERTLSPAALVQAALGTSVELVRTDPATGAVTRVPVTIRGGAGKAVLFESADGVEALHCSGVSQRFSFSPAVELGASPTLSVRVSSDAPVTATATLSYLAGGFDWAADYVATLSSDHKSLNLGGWVTLANGNAMNFPSVQAQVVAGAVNRVPERVNAFSARWSSQPLARCWPAGSSSDVPLPPPLPQPTPIGRGARFTERLQDAPIAATVFAPSAVTVQQEELGDLKLYRIPERTDIASHQMKQVRLLDRQGIPTELLFSAEFKANETRGWGPGQMLLRTQNDLAHHLDLPLPAGHVAVNLDRRGQPLLLSENRIGDTAPGERVEIALGNSPDVQMRADHDLSAIDVRGGRDVPLLPGVSHLPAAVVDDSSAIWLSNARAEPISVEIRVRLRDGMQLIAATPVPVSGGTEPVFRMTVPAHGRATLRYQTEHTH